MSKLVTIFGGSGFVGRYVAERMAKKGWRVRVAVRRPNEALFVRQYGAVGQVEPVLCNIRDDASVLAAAAGADAVVNCVGILSEVGKNKFQEVQAFGSARVARVSSEQGVMNFVQISAIGANEDSSSNYARTKALGEASVLKYFPEATILRPSIIYGDEDNPDSRLTYTYTNSGDRGEEPYVVVNIPDNFTDSRVTSDLFTFNFTGQSNRKGGAFDTDVNRIESFLEERLLSELF